MSITLAPPSGHPPDPRKPKRGKASDDPGFLYWLSEAPDYRFVKVGYTTTTPEGRLSQLQCGNPRILDLLAVRPVSHVAAMEYQLHGVFRKDHVFREWFRMSDQLRHFIAELGGRVPLPPPD